MPALESEDIAQYRAIFDADRIGYVLLWLKINLTRRNEEESKPAANKAKKVAGAAKMAKSSSPKCNAHGNGTGNR
jgi:hypothetical protein